MHASVDIEALSQEIYNESAFVDRIIEASGRVIVGQTLYDQQAATWVCLLMAMCCLKDFLD